MYTLFLLLTLASLAASKTLSPLSPYSTNPCRTRSSLDYSGSQFNYPLESRTNPQQQSSDPCSSPVTYLNMPMQTPPMYTSSMRYNLQPQLTMPSFHSHTMSSFHPQPVDFLGNGKPSTIWVDQWDSSNGLYRPTKPQELFQDVVQGNPQQKPQRAESVVHTLQKPYVFNGNPTKMFVLNDINRALGANALDNFYP
ncbi:hypothetical protein Zmor_022518 [Zophobas morio]|uniref:Uncharacterized protein n=1 Tax=Zophobas morio TaxID=2755281 RepID=A0AA38HXS6_9CUCU|nr:hypothetical protein Zmor_022518 [Zophobas morio]